MHDAVSKQQRQEQNS